MGWCTTSDLDRFITASASYLKPRAAENTLLLSAAAEARAQAGLLFGWWQPPDGSVPRGAFLHNPPAPLLIAGRSPEMAAALAATLAKSGRTVCGVDAPVEVADAFAAAWSQRSGLSVQVHRNCRVYRLACEDGDPPAPAAAQGPAAQGPAAVQGHAAPATAIPATAIPATAIPATAIPATAIPAVGIPAVGIPAMGGPAPGRLRVATRADRDLLVDWLTAFAAEARERIGEPGTVADELLGYGGAAFWEAPQRVSRIREAAQYLAGPHHREAAHRADLAYSPVALAAITRPVAGTVRIGMVYTPPERRRNGYAAALTFAVSRAVLARDGRQPLPPLVKADQVVLITDRNRPDRRVARLGYQFIGERAVLRFGQPTGPLPRQKTGPMPRLPTGPLPRPRRGT